jgi:casein kinase 1
MLNCKAQYASLHTNLGIEQIRRNEVCDLLYIILFAWLAPMVEHESQVQKKKKYDKIMEKKMTTKVKHICEC